MTYMGQVILASMSVSGKSNPAHVLQIYLQLLSKNAALQVHQFCKNYRELKSMGFDVATVVGALVLHRSDLAAATDACLSAQ